MTRFGSYLATAALLLGGLGLAACSDDSDTAPLSPSAVNTASPAAGSAGASPSGSVAALPGVRSVSPEDTYYGSGWQDRPSAYQFSVSHADGDLHVTLINDDWDSVPPGANNGDDPGRTRAVRVYHCLNEPTHVWQDWDEAPSEEESCGSSLSTVRVAFPNLSRDLPYTLPPIDLVACTGWVVVWLHELDGDRANGWRNEPCPLFLPGSPPGSTRPPSPGASGGAAPSGSSGSSGSDPIALQLGGGPSVFTVPAGGATTSGFNLYTANPDDYLELQVTKLPAGRSLGDGISGSQGSYGLWAYHRFNNNRRYGVGEWARGGLSVGGILPAGIACGDYVVPYKVIRHPTGHPNPRDGFGEQREGSFVVRVVSTPEADHCSGTAPGAASGAVPIALQRAEAGYESGDLQFILSLNTRTATPGLTTTHQAVGAFAAAATTLTVDGDAQEPKVGDLFRTAASGTLFRVTDVATSATPPFTAATSFMLTFSPTSVAADAVADNAALAAVRAPTLPTPISGLRLRTVNPDDYLQIKDMSGFPYGRSRGDGLPGQYGLWGQPVQGGQYYREGDWARGGMDVGGTLPSSFGQHADYAALCEDQYTIDFDVIRHDRVPTSSGDRNEMGNRRSGTIRITFTTGAGCNNQ